MTLKLKYTLEPAEEVRAKLYRNGHLYSTGKATVSKDTVIFHPTKPKSLGMSPNDKIRMRGKKNLPLISLALSPVEGSDSDKIWTFERIS